MLANRGADDRRPERGIGRRQQRRELRRGKHVQSIAAFW
jgi:hypothetical protein